MTLRTAWWATSEPAPKAMPCIIVLPIPLNIPVRWVVCGCMGACWAGWGLVAANELLGGGDDDLDDPPLDPPRGIYTILKLEI